LTSTRVGKPPSKRRVREQALRRPDLHPVHGPMPVPGPPLPVGMAPRTWWQGRYRSPRQATWTAVTSQIPAVNGAAAPAVDLGCGGRPFDSALWARGYRAIGLDVVGHAADVNGAVEHLPFATDSLSLVLCVNVLQYVATPDRACREACRVLRPGGRFVACLPAVSPFDHLDLWRWTGLSAAEQLEQAGLVDIGVVTVGSTVGNLLHLVALSVRKLVPVVGLPLAALLELLAAWSQGAPDQRLPVGYVVAGTKPHP